MQTNTVDDQTHERNVRLTLLVKNSEALRTQSCDLVFCGAGVDISSRFFNNACAFFNNSFRDVLQLDTKDTVIDLVKIVDNGVIVYNEHFEYESDKVGITW